MDGYDLKEVCLGVKLSRVDLNFILIVNLLGLRRILEISKAITSWVCKISFTPYDSPLLPSVEEIVTGYHCYFQIQMTFKFQYECF